MVIGITVVDVGGVEDKLGVVVSEGDGEVPDPGEEIVVGDGVEGEMQGSWQDLPSV